MTAEELLRLPRGRSRYQLIRGNLRTEPLSGVQDGEVATAIAANLFGHVKEHHLGKVCIGVGFQIESDPDTVLGADVAFIRSCRVVKTPKFFQGPPDLVIELISDRPDKTADWLRSGARSVIVVDPPRRGVRIHRPGETIDVTDTITVDDIVPGWQLRISEIFED